MDDKLLRAYHRLQDMMGELGNYVEAGNMEGASEVLSSIYSVAYDAMRHMDLQGGSDGAQKV